MKKTGWIRILAVLLAMTAFLTLPVSAEETKKIGLVTEDGQQHIYTTAGTLVKNVPAYKCKVNGKTNYYSIDKKGTATRLKGVKAMAAKRLVKLKAGGKKSIKNLKKAFKWSAGLNYRSNTNGSRGSKAAKYYGKYGFSTGSGDCNTAAYTFYWMAKVLGYSPKAVQGYVPNGSMSNLKPHAWVTIKFKKQLFYFDPDLNRAYAGKTVRTASGWVTQGKYCGFKFRYGTPGTYKYMN